MLNRFGQSVTPLVTVDFMDDDPAKDRVGHVFVVDDNGWLMYEYCGVLLAEELDEAKIVYKTL